MTTTLTHRWTGQPIPLWVRTELDDSEAISGADASGDDAALESEATVSRALVPSAGVSEAEVEIEVETERATEGAGVGPGSVTVGEVEQEATASAQAAISDRPRTVPRSWLLLSVLDPMPDHPLPGSGAPVRPRGRVVRRRCRSALHGHRDPRTVVRQQIRRIGDHGWRRSAHRRIRSTPIPAG